MAYASEAKINKLQRNVVTCLSYTRKQKLSKPTIALFLWILFFVFHSSGLNSEKAIGKRNDPTNNALFQYPLTCIQLQPFSQLYLDSHQRLKTAVTTSIQGTICLTAMFYTRDRVSNRITPVCWKVATRSTIP